VNCATRKSNFYFRYFILIQLPRLTAGGKSLFLPLRALSKHKKPILLYYFSRSSDSAPVNFTDLQTNVIN